MKAGGCLSFVVMSSDTETTFKVDRHIKIAFRVDLGVGVLRNDEFFPLKLSGGDGGSGDGGWGG